MSETVFLKAADGFEFPSYVARPAQAARGAVVVVQEIFGVNSPPSGGPWITDGTDLGTFPLFDESMSSWETCSDDKFGARYLITRGLNGAVLFSTDGSRAGTRSVMSLPANTYYCPSKGATVVGSSLAYLQIGNRLLQTDGSESGTIPVAGAPIFSADGTLGEPPRMIAALGHWLVFI